MTQFLDTPQGRRIAYNRTEGEGPWIVFLGGFRSDMDGTKAVHLEVWARDAGLSFLRFDYSGHGASGGRFEDGAIGDWAEDAQAVIAALTDGPVLLVGSSMGGWIALLVARDMDRVMGMVGIAAAPDFTENAMWAELGDAERETLMRDGQIELPSDYDAPYTVTRRLIEDGRRHLMLRSDLRHFGPVRLLQGTEDAAVDRSVALRLLDRLQGDARLTLVKGVDHRFSDPDCLRMIELAILDVAGRMRRP